MRLIFLDDCSSIKLYDLFNEFLFAIRYFVGYFCLFFQVKSLACAAKDEKCREKYRSGGRFRTVKHVIELATGDEHKEFFGIVDEKRERP